MLTLHEKSALLGISGGFATERENVKAHALQKLKRKQLQLIMANDVSNQDIGFNSDNNAATAYWPNAEQHLDTQSKYSLALQLNKFFAEHFSAQSQ